jgi:hypothetical protein
LSPLHPAGGGGGGGGGEKKQLPRRVPHNYLYRLPRRRRIDSQLHYASARYTLLPLLLLPLPEPI